MDATNLRVALFSGNYNYVRDGANQALNRLGGYLLQTGAKVRIYAEERRPGFPVDRQRRRRAGDPVSRPRRISRAARHAAAGRSATSGRSAPNIFHISAPEILGHRAVTLARKMDVPVVASVHTRFETYFRYYNMAWLEPLVEAIIRRFYRRCDAIFAPSESMAQVLREQRMSYDIGIWSRGVETDIFAPAQRDMEWRRSRSASQDDEPVIGFIGRVVMEKGLDVFAEAIDVLHRRGVPHKVLVIGEGPARQWFEPRLARTRSSSASSAATISPARSPLDMLLNPSRDRDVRQRHAGGDGVRPAGGRGARDRQPEPGRRQCHRPADPPRRERGIRRRAQALLRGCWRRARPRARPGAQ